MVFIPPSSSGSAKKIRNVTVSGTAPTANQVLTASSATAAAWAAATGGATVKVGSFTRAQDGATATVAYTGVGFVPKALIFTWAVSGVVGGGVGFSDGTNHNSSNRATDNKQTLAAGFIIQTLDNGSWAQDATVNSFDSDGFTLGWRRSGSSPAGTITVYYIAIK